MTLPIVPLFRPEPAAFATSAARTRGRLFPEADSRTRTPFQRDRDRVVHSGAFRKLKDKTQVFVSTEGDYYRTRLTHSLEVAQIARSIARTLGLDEDLTEAIALAHDLGHTCFGHAGEEALNEAMAPYGGFAHNDQTLRILTRLERRYPDFDGLNLTWETLEGVVKHNGPVVPTSADAASPGALPPTLAAFNAIWDLELRTYAGPEAQVAALADDIAYNNHDMDDGLRATLFSLDDLNELPLIEPVLRDVRRHYPGLDRTRLIHETIRRLIGLMVEDVVAETRRRLALVRPDCAAAVRHAGMPLVEFSEPMRDHSQMVRAFLKQHMYRHYKVNRVMSKARRVVRDLFVLLMAEPNCLPTDWQHDLAVQGGTTDASVRARLIADYIAGMTDRYALGEHSRLFDMGS
ncbi:MAG: deoxyguanosinetriphosphate triphosphohydrolase [Azospirillaceae bacterium]|nr:deoxyguanosinetriphosphate triphosphohydrolase [Azospirillaceae bacterium]